jgi:hypothetical protein
MKTKELEELLPDWLELDNVMLRKGGHVTRALAHSDRGECGRCVSVLFDADGKAYVRRFSGQADIPDEIRQYGQGDGRKAVYVNGFKYIRDESVDLDVD